MQKKTLLLILGISPFPQDSGGAIRSKNTIIQFSKNFNIYSVIFVDPSYTFAEKEINFLTNLTTSFSFLKIREKSLLVSFLKAIPYHLTCYWNSKLKTIIQSLEKEVKFDEVWIESTQLLYASSFIRTRTKIVFTAYDILTVSFYRRAIESKSFFKKLLRFISLFQVYFYEGHYLKYFNKVITTSEVDSSRIKQLFNPKNVDIIPNGIDKIHFLPYKKKPLYVIGYIGSSSHTPNIFAIDFILNKIVPHLRVLGLKFEIMIVGKNCLTNSGIEELVAIDYLEDVEEFYQKIDLLVAPIFSGSGTRVKILESLSYGRPVITTIIGAEGLPINSNYLSIISKSESLDPQIWSGKISRILNNIKKFDVNNYQMLKKQLKNLTWERNFGINVPTEI